MGIQTKEIMKKHEIFNGDKSVEDERKRCEERGNDVETNEKS